VYTLFSVCVNYVYTLFSVCVNYVQEQETREPLKPIDLSRDTHTRKNGSFVNLVVEGLYVSK
jgi:hypothetical protein